MYFRCIEGNFEKRNMFIMIISLVVIKINEKVFECIYNLGVENKVFRFFGIKYEIS